MPAYTHTTKYLILGMLLIVFAWVGVFGIVSVLHMSLGEHQTRCTLILGDNVVCAMNAFEYLSVGQKMFAVPPASISSFLLLVIACGFILRTRIQRKLFFPPKPILSLEMPRVFTLYVPNTYTELFSQGILCPKAP